MTDFLMDHCGEIFSPYEAELIAMSRAVLRDGLTRLKGRTSLLPSSNSHKVANDTRAARDAITMALCADYGALRHEVAVMVLIDAQGRYIATEEFPRGEAARVQVSARLCAEFVIKHGASFCLLAHNHPSGDNTPSKPDIKLTNDMGQWLAEMQCGLIDHLVLAGDEASTILGNW